MTDYIKPFMHSPTHLTSDPPITPITSHIFIEDEVDNNDYRYESARLKSFDDWPCTWINSEGLATAGFYYTGEKDKVRCFECRIEICRWESDDNPMTEHQRWSARCRFVRNIPCGNVPVDADSNTIPTPAPRGRDTCGLYGIRYMPYSRPDTDYERLPAQIKVSGYDDILTPKHPEFASYDARLHSFETWPVSKSQNKEDLSTAGFFYTKTADQTLCYYCGGGLRDWDPEDEPWQEHAKWFDYCPYLITVKGRDFISKITGKTYSCTDVRTPTGITLPTSSSLKKKDETTQHSNDVNAASGSSQNLTSSEIMKSMEFVAGPSEANSEPIEEQSTVKTLSDTLIDKDARMCKICYTRELRMVFMPCGHLLACAECAKNMKICGVCRKPVKITVQAYIP